MMTCRISRPEDIEVKKSNSISIIEDVKRSIRRLTAVLLILALIALGMMLVCARIIFHATSRMDSLTMLKPVVSTDIPESIWFVVSGRQSFEESGAMEMIEHVTGELDRLSASEPDSLQLTVARRTMETLQSYVLEIEQNMENEEPVVKSEATLGEIRAVASLVADMLNDCITAKAQELAKESSLLVNTVAVMAAVELIVMALVLWNTVKMQNRVNATITEPIDELEEVAGRLAEGELGARAEETNIVELSDLTNSINTMADQLQTLIDQNNAKQEKLKKAELRTLQAQINPHFLYNTLDTILWQAEDENSEEVIRLTKSLSDFFRISLSSGKDWISVEQEISHINGYLQIQKTRYRDILNYSVDVEKQIMGEQILKLLLQPLVENALYHGIKERRGGGKITVTGRKEGDSLFFCVYNDGVGMTPEKLEQVRRSLREDIEMPHGEEFPGYTGSGFGLRNVDQRIRLYYNLSEGLSIDSGQNGTTVSFRVPLKGSEE